MKPAIAALAVSASFVILAGGAHGALPLAHPGPTVDDYTAAQSRRAQEAAEHAGFENLQIVMVQDGNFFLRGQMQGKTYAITVVPDGKVYSSTPSTD